MKELSVKAVYLRGGINLCYFAGTLWNASERMVGALLFEGGCLEYIVSKFEEGTFKSIIYNKKTKQVQLVLNPKDEFTPNAYLRVNKET